jgi:hypothetical protein
MQQSTTLPGDVLLITAFISYVGCFTKHYRQELLHKIWTPFVKTLDVRVFIIIIEIIINYWYNNGQYGVVYTLYKLVKLV